MKLKTLLIVVAFLAALSAAAWLFNRATPSPSQTDARIGQPVITTAATEKAARIKLTENGKTVLLVRGDDSVWHIASYHDLPADFAKLAMLVKSLNSTPVERLVTTSPDRIKRLEFLDTNITVLDSADKPLLRLALGKPSDTGGRYLRFSDENKAYLARLNIWLDVEPKNWADTVLTKFASNDIAKVSITLRDNSIVTASRSDAQTAFAIDSVPAGQRLKHDAIPSLISTLSGLRFTDTSATDDPNAVGARNAARKITLQTFDGKTLSFALGREPERTVVKADALKPAPTSFISRDPKGTPSELVGAVTGKSPAGPVFVFIKHSDASAPVNALMQKRAFQIPEATLDALPADGAALFESIPPATPAPAVPPPATPSPSVSTTTPEKTKAP